MPYPRIVCFVGAAETVAPPERTSVKICAICGRIFSASRFCEFGAICGRIVMLVRVLLGWCTSCSGKRQSRVGIAAHLMDNLWVENKKMELNGIVVSIFFVSLPREYPNITN